METLSALATLRPQVSSRTSSAARTTQTKTQNNTVNINYDTVLPDRLRARLKRKASKKPLKLIYKIAIVLVLFAGLRHLNTVPHREWKTAWTTAEYWELKPGMNENDRYSTPNSTIHHSAVEHEDMVYTSEELFGSSYRGSIAGNDLGVSSKQFADILRLMPRYHKI